MIRRPSYSHAGVVVGFIVARSRTQTDPNVRMFSAEAEGGQDTYARLSLRLYGCWCSSLYMSVHVCMCINVVLLLTGVISVR